MALVYLNSFVTETVDVPAGTTIAIFFLSQSQYGTRLTFPGAQPSSYVMVPKPNGTYYTVTSTANNFSVRIETGIGGAVYSVENTAPSIRDLTDQYIKPATIYLNGSIPTGNFTITPAWIAAGFISANHPNIGVQQSYKLPLGTLMETYFALPVGGSLFWTMINQTGDSSGGQIVLSGDTGHTFVGNQFINLNCDIANLRTTKTAANVYVTTRL